MAQLTSAIAVVRHPGEVGERVASLVEPAHGFAGIFLNAATPLQGIHAPALMRETARRCLLSKTAAPDEAARQLLAAVDSALQPLSSSPMAAEDFDARWDLGGHAGLIMADDDQVAVARVGDVRVLLVADGSVRTLLHEHTLAAQLKRDPMQAASDVSAFSNVVTAFLGGSGLPPDTTSVIPAPAGLTVIIASSHLVAGMADEMALDCAHASPDDAARTLADAVGGQSRSRPTGAILVARLGAS